MKLYYRVNVFKPLFASTRRYASKPKMTSNIAYFRYVGGEAYFYVTFQLTDVALQVNKQFNFCRQITEKVGTFMNRVDANIVKTLDKKKKKNKNVETVEDRNINSFLLKEDLPVDHDLMCSDIFLGNSKYSLMILGNKLPIEINCPWIDVLTLPKNVMSGFLLYPSKFEAFFAKQELSKWSWSRSENRGGPWKLISNAVIYETSNSDVGKYIRVCCKPMNEEGRIGPEFEAISPDTVSAGPGLMACEERHKFTINKLNPNGLRIVSYNILADYYVDSEYSRTVLFGYCPAYALELSYRRQLIMKELLGYNADILCLQEVDMKVHKHDLLPILKLYNFDGEFCQKGSVCEGTAIFYDKAKFKTERVWREQLSEAFDNNPMFEELRNKLAENESFLIRVRERSTTLQVVLLQSLVQPDQMILLGNIHLYFHPDADHVRLFQSILCAKYLENLLQDLQNEFNSKKITLILCGDFNSIPECGIYSLLTTGNVSEDHIDWSSNEEEAVRGINFSHSLTLKSACDTPQYTNYTLQFKACLDYIFYNPNNFIIEQVVPFPNEEDLSLHGAIPSIIAPSDHIALVADLKWKN